MKNLLIRWVLLSLLCATAAHADIRFERFIPTNPTSDFAPTAELWFSGSFGLVTCDYVGAVGTLEADSVTVSGNVVRLQIPVSRRPGPCPIFVPLPGELPHTRKYLLPILATGNYTLEIVGRRVFSTDPLFNITTVPLTIGVGSLVNVPLLTGWGFALLILTVLVFGMFRARLKALVTLSLVLLAGNLLASPPPVPSNSYTIEITLRAGSNRTTADALVSNGLNGALIAALANPALRNLRLAQGQRPSGAYQSWLNARPNAPAAVLARIAFADVPDRANAEAIVTALRLNADVQSAYGP